METIKVNQDVVAVKSPRKSVINSTIIYRFGYEEFPGTGMARCGVIASLSPLSEEQLRRTAGIYCAERGIKEDFIPSEYGF